MTMLQQSTNEAVADGLAGRRMSGLSFNERMKIRSISFEQARRRAVTMALSPPFLKWRYASSASDQILIVPQDLRLADPSFWFEYQHGHFGLATEVADLRGASPFGVVPPSEAWARALHEFGWLRHFAAVDTEEATETAQQLVFDWIASRRIARGIAFEPAVMARRLMSWIAQANMLLEDVDAHTYGAIMSSIGEQVASLKANWRNAPNGVPRMTCLISLVQADLAISGHDRELTDELQALIYELNIQILDDGEHISRNPSVLADIVLDLLPLGQCFHPRGRKAPQEISAFISKALAFLHFMRLGDGQLARFNGVGLGSPAALATVLGYTGDTLERVSAAEASGYARIENGETVLIVDIGSPPPLEVSMQAHAGALSFEMSSRARPIFVNGGAPGPAHTDWDSVARATASHNTLCLADTSSSRLVRHEKLENILGGLPIRGPDMVAVSMTSDAKSAVLACSHDGYVSRFSLMHSRRLSLSNDGKVLNGADRLEPSAGRRAEGTPLPFAIHFHLHPECRCEHKESDNVAKIVVGDGQVWQFSSNDAEMSVEDSLHFADSAGPRMSVQIVLRGVTRTGDDVAWAVTAQDEA